MSKDPLKYDFLDIFLTTSFGVRKFKNISVMGVILFLKIFTIESYITKCKKEMEKLFFVPEKIASENVGINCLYYEQNACYRQPIGQEGVLTFCISFRETFPT